jgi:hypothetical protein
MTSKLGQCFLGWAKGKQRYEGPVNDAAVEKTITGADGKAKFARESHYYDRDISTGTPFSSREGLLEQFSIYTGVDMRHLGAYFRDPSALLGEKTVSRIHQVYIDHIAALKAQGLDPLTARRTFDEAIKKLPAKYQLSENLDAAEAYFKGDANALNKLRGVSDKADFIQKVRPAMENMGKAKQIWDATAAPQIEQIKLAAAGNTDPVLGDYLDKYFAFQSQGGQLYANKGGHSVLNVLVRNAVGNLTAWNPMIATMNVFEYVPKATSYALMNGQSPTVVLKALSNLMTKTGGKPFARVADWEARGIYGTGAPAGPLNYLEQSEGLLRNLSASLGEVMGQAPELAVEKVAFVNRFGNEMQPYWSSAGAESVSLMRFAFASNKMYLNFFGQMAMGIKNGDMAQAGKAAAALAMFSIATSIQTGGISAIPAPVAFILKETDPELYETIKEIDQENPALNIAKHVGLNISEKMQPAGGFAVGVGYSVAQNDVVGGLKSAGMVLGDLKEGELGLAGARLVDASLGVGQVARIPGVNLSTKRLSKALVKQLEEDAEINADYLFRAKEAMGFESAE